MVLQGLSSALDAPDVYVARSEVGRNADSESRLAMQRWGLMVMLGLSRSCWAQEEGTQHPPVPPTVRVVPLTHPPGTLLHDAADRYWVVARWPDREEIVASMMPLAHYDLREAIPLSAEEARCLRPSTRVWFARFLWRLTRLSNGELWYTNEAQGYRRRARPSVVAAWRESPDRAETFVGTRETLEVRFRDLGPMPPPDGAIFSHQGRYLYFAEGVLHPFMNRELAEQVGYTLTSAVPVSMAELADLGPVGEMFTPSTFQVCPLAAAQLRQGEDHDEDGTPFFEDCDDDDARRHPGHTEICDGVDNDCDLVVDNGFDVGFRCVMEDGCNTPAYTRCADHRLGTVCWDDEAVCE